MLACKENHGVITYKKYRVSGLPESDKKKQVTSCQNLLSRHTDSLILFSDDNPLSCGSHTILKWSRVLFSVPNIIQIKNKLLGILDMVYIVIEFNGMVLDF